MNQFVVTGTNGQRLSQRIVQRGLRTTIVSGMLSFVWIATAQGITMALFMEALGASGLMIGLVTAVAQLSCVMQIPGAFLAGRTRNRKRIQVWMTLPARALWFLPVFFALFLTDSPIATAWCMIILTAITSFLTQGGAAFWFSWIADLIPEKIRGKFWGLYQTCTMAVYLVSMLVAGRILDWFPSPGVHGGAWTGFALVFGISAVSGTIAVIIQAFVPEPEPSLEKAVKLVSFNRLLEPLRQRDFRKLTIAMGIYTFSLGLVSLGLIYLRKKFDVTYSQLAMLTGISSMGTAIFGIIWGYVMDRVGGRALGALLLVLAPLCSIPWFFVKNYHTNITGLFEGVFLLDSTFSGLISILPDGIANAVLSFTLPQPIWIFSITSLFGGILYGGLGVCHLSLSSGLAPKTDRTMAMGVHWAIIGLIGASGSLFAGRIMDYFAEYPIPVVFPTGTEMSFHHVLIVVHMTIMWLVLFPMFLTISKRKEDLSFGKAFNRLIMNNPLRSVTYIYIMSASVTSAARARAVRKIGKKRAAIAVSDLIQKLSDPSSEVREEAAFALARIGGSDAIGALIDKLNDPYSDLAPQIARALRSVKNPEAVDALVGKLSDPDRETKTESARTLGEIGDRRAVSSLLDLLSSTRDDKVASASSEALARLGEFAAVYEILPRMWNTRNPVLKRSLAVAVGDLIGERDGFYKLLSLEQQTHGDETHNLLQDIGRKIRNNAGPGMKFQAKNLVAKTYEIAEAYDTGKLAECTSMLFYLAIGIAALKWSVEFGDDSKAMIDDIIWRDQHLGIGVWFLDSLKKQYETGDADSLDEIDILLGIYFLACVKIDSP